MENRKGMPLWKVVQMSADIVSSTPEELFANGIAYMQYCDDTPITTRRKIQSGKSAGDAYTVEHTRPYTVKGLCLFCNISEDYLSSIKNSKDKSNSYYVVVMKLLYLIYVQNMENAMVDIFNPIFTAKVLVMDKGEDQPTQGVRVEVVNGLPELLDSEVAILEKLERENPEWMKR